mgnify:CR=1 FL=1
MHDGNGVLVDELIPGGELGVCQGGDGSGPVDEVRGLELGFEVAVDFGYLVVEEVCEAVTKFLRRGDGVCCGCDTGELFDNGKEFFAVVGDGFDPCS